MAMRISDLLRVKGNDVVTVTPTDTVTRLLQVLSQHRIGAVVVSADGERIDGIVSERDVVRKLPDGGAGMLEGPVSAIMVTEVHTCTASTSVEELAALMTQHRFRHVPVVEDGRLTAIVSIGDVVKGRLSQLESERDHLVGYIQQ